MGDLSLTSSPGGLQRPVETYTPSEVERFLVARVRERVNPTARISIRWALERNWYENILFFLGRQWLDYDVSSRRFTDLRAPAWFPKPVDNQIWPRAERLIAQLLKRSPSARVRPNSNRATDREAARDAEALLGHIDDEVGEELLRQRASSCAVLTGTVVSCEGFNPQAGPELAVPQMQVNTVPMMQDVSTCAACGQDSGPEGAGTPCPACATENAGLPSILQPARRQVTMGNGSPAYDVERVPVTDAEGQPIVDKFHVGEIESEIVLPFEFYVDENTDTLQQAEWCGRAVFRPLEWVDRNFPDRGRYVSEDSGLSLESFYRNALLFVIGGPGTAVLGGEYMRGELLRGGTTVIEYQERPSKFFPNGLHLIVANEVLLFAGELPVRGQETGSGEFSYSEFRYTLVPGRFWGGTPIEQMKPLQRTVNSIRSQIIINRKTILNPWILAPDGCGLVAGNVAMRPGVVIPYNWSGLGTAPQIVPGQPLPEQIIAEWRMALESMDRIAATEEASIGAAPEGIKSGVALAQLAESAETAHLPRMRRWEEFIASRGRKRLLLAQRHYREERLVKTLGAGSVWQVRRLTGADLQGNTDVTVEAGSSLPRSRMAQIQLILDLIGIPGLIDVQAPGLREKILEEVGLQAIEPDSGPDTRKAVIENAEMDQGVLPTQVAPFTAPTGQVFSSVGKYEDHIVHVREHLLEIRDPRFDQKSPPAQQAYLEHLGQHRLAELFTMQGQLPAAGMPGAPGPGGGPAPGAPAPSGPAGVASPESAPTG